VKIDNLKLVNDAPENVKLNLEVDFNLPDGSSVSDIIFERMPEWAPYSESENKITKLMLHGLTTKNVEDLVPYAKSWVNAPPLLLKSDFFVSKGYDKTQLAYVIQAKSSMNNVSLKLTLMGSMDSPIYNPSFVIKDWKPNEFDLFIDDKKAKAGHLYQFGMEKSLEGNYLVLWNKIESTKPVYFDLRPKNG
jgi:hypothetical protein